MAMPGHLVRGGELLHGAAVLALAPSALSRGILIENVAATLMLRHVRLSAAPFVQAPES